VQLCGSVSLVLLAIHCCPISLVFLWAGGWTKFYRRERPELRLDSAGNPSVFYSGIEYGEDHPQKQYSFSIVQQVRGGKLD